VSRPIAAVAGVALWGGLVAGLALWGGTVVWSPGAAADEPQLLAPAGEQAPESSGKPGKLCRSADSDWPSWQRPEGEGGAAPEEEGAETAQPSTLEPARMRPGAGDPGAGDPGAGDPDSGDPGSGDPGSGDPGSSGPGSSGTGDSDPAAGAGAGDPAGDDRAGDDPAAGPVAGVPGSGSRGPGDRPAPATGEDLAGDDPPDAGAGEVADEQLTPVAATEPSGRIGLLGVIAAVCVVAASSGLVRTLLSQRATRAESR